MTEAAVRVKLVFPEELVRRPLLAELTRALAVEPNIRRAAVDHDGGWIVCELKGEASAVDEGIEWLRGHGVEVELIGDVLEG